jgi:hypothetical protein
MLTCLLVNDLQKVKVGHSLDTKEDIINSINNGFIHVVFYEIEGGPEITFHINKDSLNDSFFRGEETTKKTLKASAVVDFSEMGIDISFDLDQRSGEAKMVYL